MYLGYLQLICFTYIYVFTVQPRVQFKVLFTGGDKRLPNLQTLSFPWLLHQSKEINKANATFAIYKFGKCLHWLAKGGGGVWQMLTLADKGARGGLTNDDSSDKNA